MTSLRACCGVAAIAVSGSAAVSVAQVAKPPATTKPVAATTRITAVEGPSTLRHLGLSITGTSMGWAGHWSGPPSSVPRTGDPEPSEPAASPFVLTGADLYRISCQACHKPDGTGAPEQIRSIIGPVHAASLPWMSNDMKARGRSVDAAFLRQLTTANEADLRTRLRQGGHDMPAFGQISDQEYLVLRPYLDQLSGIAAPAALKTIAEPPDRVGELVIKGTCHICHDATSNQAARPTVQNAVIPSLSSFTQMRTFAEFREKVRAGAGVPLNEADGPLARGRMPVFDYITPPEVAAAYAYLIRYPPLLR